MIAGKIQQTTNLADISNTESEINAKTNHGSASRSQGKSQTRTGLLNNAKQNSSNLASVYNDGHVMGAENFNQQIQMNGLPQMPQGD